MIKNRNTVYTVIVVWHYFFCFVLSHNFWSQRNLSLCLHVYVWLHTRRHRAVYRCNVTWDSTALSSMGREHGCKNDTCGHGSWILAMCSVIIVDAAIVVHIFVSSSVLACSFGVCSPSRMLPLVCWSAYNGDQKSTVCLYWFLYSTTPSSVSCLTDVSWFHRTVYKEVANSLRTKNNGVSQWRPAPFEQCHRCQGRDFNRLLKTIMFDFWWSCGASVTSFVYNIISL